MDVIPVLGIFATLCPGGASDGVLESTIFHTCPARGRFDGGGRRFVGVVAGAFGGAGGGE